MKMKHYETITREYYSAGEVADLFGIAQSKLRFWLESFDIDYLIKRDNHLNRKFTQHDIETVKIIYDLLCVERYTIEGAKRKFKIPKP